MTQRLMKVTQSIEHIFAFQRSPYQFFDKVKPENSNEIKKLRLGFKKFNFCYHPDHAQHVLQDNKDNYPKSKLVLSKILSLSGPKGLIQLSDKEARPVRQSAGKLMHPERANKLSEYIESFVEEEFELLDVAAKNNEVVDFKPFLTHLVLRTAGVFILNTDVRGQAKELNNAFVELNRMAGESLRQVVSFPFSYKRNRYLKVIHKELGNIIDEQLKKSQSSLLNELAKKNYSKSFLTDQVKAFMFAGYDTTASSLIFAVDSVARSAECQDNIFAESSLSYRSAKYTLAAYKESLRLYPSAYFLPRQVKADDIVCGQNVEKGSQIFISIRHVQRCPEVFDSPDEFKPTRFLSKLSHDFAFIPFGGGSRICIGAPLAVMEATVVLKKICERYRLTPVNHKAPEIEGLITAHTKSPLLLRVQRRAG